MKKAKILERFEDYDYYNYKTFFRAIIKIINENKEESMYFIDFNRTLDHGPEGMSVEISDYEKDNPNKVTFIGHFGKDEWTYFGEDDNEEEFDKCIEDFIKYYDAELITDKPKVNRITEIEEDLDILD